MPEDKWPQKSINCVCVFVCNRIPACCGLCVCVGKHRIVISHLALRSDYYQHLITGPHWICSEGNQNEGLLSSFYTRFPLNSYAKKKGICGLTLSQCFWTINVFEQQCQSKDVELSVFRCCPGFRGFPGKGMQWWLRLCHLFCFPEGPGRSSCWMDESQRATGHFLWQLDLLHRLKHPHYWPEMYFFEQKKKIVNCQACSLGLLNWILYMVFTNLIIYTLSNKGCHWGSSFTKGALLFCLGTIIFT